MSKIRTRFAPSPTGYMHIGNLRTAIYAFLFAKHNQGEFLLRIEDTDQTRKVEGADKVIIDILNKFGLKHDNKEVIYQSKRIKIYQKFADQLIKENKAYYCFCTAERLDQMRKEQQEKNQAPKYDRTCCKLTADEIKVKLESNEPHVIRLKMPDNEKISWTDLIRGKVEFNSNDVDDQILIKSDGYPTYHLANIIDDHEMEITHVIRGEEWLSSTPKHLILYKYFDWQPPQFAHPSLLLNPDKSKLSKRQGDVAVSDYLNKGYLPEAIFNFLATIGWTESKGAEQEIYSINELIDKFDITRVNKSGAIFNLEKLDHINGWYIRQLKIEELVELCKPYIQDIKDNDLITKIVTVEQERLKKLSDISENIEFYHKNPKYDRGLLIWKKSTQEQTLENLVKTEDFLTSLTDNDFQDFKTLEQKIIKWIKENKYGVGDILWPMRAALSGQKNSPGPFEIAWVLGKEKTIERLNQAQKLLR